MKNVLGVINLVNELDHLEELTYKRCVASVPFGARYRLMDFILSSMVNSGMINIAVFAHTKYRSLVDHLGTGKDWDLNRKRGGLFTLPPAVDEIREIVKGDLYHFYSNRDYFYRSPQEYVLVSRSHMVCNIDLTEVFEHHKTSGADITLIYKDLPEEDLAECRRIIVNPLGHVKVMQDHTGRLQSSKVSMEMFLMRKDLLLDLVETSLAQGYDHFVRDAIMKNVDRLKIIGFPYQGHLGIINTIQSYYHQSMNLLNPQIWRELFFTPGAIYTKIKDEPPARYLQNAQVKNSLVANGCVIEGEVENCILFRGVKVHKGASLRNCIVLQNCEIQDQVNMENAILDKDVMIHSGRILKGAVTAPFIAAKRKVI